MDAPYTPSAWGAAYHALPYNEVLGAGSAGPGKSLVLLMEPLAQIVMEDQRCSNTEHPYHLDWGASSGWALHLRRTLPMLQQTLVRAQKIFPQIDPGARWVASEMTWIFSSGYRYQFGHCAEEGDWDRYMSNEYSIILWDELVQFIEEQYNQISTRLRSSDPVLGLMLKNRSMSNPMMKRQSSEKFTVNDPQWVKRRFVDPAPMGKVVLSRYVTLQTGEKVKRTRMYFPATLYDNPDPVFVRQYDIELASAPPHIQQALRYGNWEITEGSHFGAEWRQNLHVCEPFEIPPHWPVFRSMDWGFKKPGNIHWWAMDDDDNLFGFYEYRFQGKLDVEVVREAREIEKKLGLWHDGRSTITGPADTQLWELRGDSLKSKAQAFQELGMPWAQADKRSRQRNSELVMQRLKDHRDGTTTPGLVLFTNCRYAIRGIPSIQTDPNNPEEPQKGGDDHAYDSVSYACAYASHGRNRLGERGFSSEEERERDLEERFQRGRYGYGGEIY